MKKLITITILLFAYTAHAQVKKITSEDLITGKIEKWIEVTDTITHKVERFDFPKEELSNGIIYPNQLPRLIIPNNQYYLSDSTFFRLNN